MTYWLQFCESGEELIYKSKPDYVDGLVHVIEYAALQQAQARVAELEAEVKRVTDLCNETIEMSREYAHRKIVVEAELKAQARHAIDKYDEVASQLEQARVALKAINDEELNSMRPGGGYSRSAKISYDALAKLTKFKNS